MKSEKQLRRNAAMVFIVALMLDLIATLLFIYARSVIEPLLQGNYSQAELNARFEQYQTYIYWGAIVYEIAWVFVIINFIQFIKLWKNFGPRFVRCFMVIYEGILIFALLGLLVYVLILLM